MFHQRPVTRRQQLELQHEQQKQQQREENEEEQDVRLDRHCELDESDTPVVISNSNDHQTAHASGQISPTASTTSYVTCTPDISHSIQTGSSSVNLAKIIDIQRTAKRRYNIESSKNNIEQQQQRRSATTSRNSVPASGTSSSAINNQLQQPLAGVSDQNRWTPSNTTVASSKAQSQKQQSGETLSSFESDYDLLVYLGETETEDIVDTERSLDYQDQTWRQSICGGASLAPTIDESLSELIGIGSSNNFNIQARNSYQDFDLLNTPTISPFKAHSPSPPRSASTSFQQPKQQQQQQRQLFRDENSPKIANHSQRQVNVRPVQQIKEVESDECDHEVSLVFKQRQQPQASTSGEKSPWKSKQAKRPDFQQQQAEQEQEREENQHQNTHQQQQKLVGNIGNKLVSLFNRKQAPAGNDLRQIPATEHVLKRFRNEEFVEPKSNLDSELYWAKSRTLGATRREINNTNNNDSNNWGRFTDLSLGGVSDNNRLLGDTKYRDSELNRIKSASLSGTKSVTGNTNMIGRRQDNNNESSSSAMSANDAAELDRLLAEMNQSLDLNSLARYDPNNRGHSCNSHVESSNFGYLRQQQPVAQADTSQTLSKFHHQATSSAVPRSTQLRQQQQLPAPQGKYAQAQYQSPPMQQQVFYNDNNNRNKNVVYSNLSSDNRLKQQTLPNKWRNADPNQGGEFYQNTQASCESILDEYDGASRMLEQMISDQLDSTNKALNGSNSAFKPAVSRNSEQQQEEEKVDEIRRVDSPASKMSDTTVQQTSAIIKPSASNKQQTANSSSPSANSATSRRESKSSVIYKEEPNLAQVIATTTATVGSDQEHTSSSLQERSRKVSTCSSSMTNTDATSVVLATKVGELQANKRDIFENRSVWRHRRSTRSSGNTATPPSGEENLNPTVPALKPSKKSAIVTQFSLDQTKSEKKSDQRALTSHSLESTPADVSQCETTLKVKNNSIIEVRKNPINGNLSTKVNTQLAPTPPAIDYGDSDGAEVIRVEAAAITTSSSSSEDENEISVLRGESQIDKMRRRTLISMRSMRNRFSDFIGNNNEKSIHHQQQRRQQQQQQQQQQVVPANEGSQKEQPSESAPLPPPKPPKRSSSIGSQGSRGKQSQVVSNNQEQALAEPLIVDERFIINNPVTNKSERMSRSKSRRLGQASPANAKGFKDSANQPSFGQQIRERLSRSKSRLSKFLRPATKRAQSTPNTKQNFKVELEHDDKKLFQPSDIARNYDIQDGITSRKSDINKTQRGEDSFNESLDRHLAASLTANKEMIATRKSSKSEESDSSLSGLDVTQSRSRSRSKRQKSNTMLANMKDTKEQQQPQQQGRSKSLLSIKRLSSFRNKDNNLNDEGINKQVEDFDSFKVSTTNELPNKNGKKRRRNRKRSEKNKSSDEQSSQTSPVVQPRVSITNDYFGQIGPAKADSHDDEALRDELSSSSMSEPSKDKKKFVMTTNMITPVNEYKQRSVPHNQLKINPQEEGASSPAIGSTNSASKSSAPNTEHRNIEHHPKRPNRSQSMKCIRRTVNGYGSTVNESIANKRDSQVSCENRTSSFSNLNRRLPSSTNTFRPISACAKLDDRLQNETVLSASSQPTDKELEVVACTRLEVVTPVRPSNSPLSGYQLDSVKPPQLDQQHSYKAASHSLRPAGSVSPIRAKSAAVLDDIRNKCSEFFTSPQTRRKAVRNKQTDFDTPDSRRPVRPPRKSNKSEGRRRSKSVHAGVAIEHASDSDDDTKQVIIAKAASPSSTLDGVRDDILSPRTTPTPKGNKLSAFAQHIKQTFQGSGNKRARGAPETRPRSPVIIEPATLVEWKPVIARSNDEQKRSTSGVVNKHLISQLGQTSKDENDSNRKQNLQRQQNYRSLDTDSTWESSGDESERRKQRNGDESSESKQSKIHQHRVLIERENDNLLQAADKLSGERATQSAGESNKFLSANAAEMSRHGRSEHSEQQPQSVRKEGFSKLEQSDNNNNDNSEGDNQDKLEELAICTSNEWKQHQQDKSKEQKQQQQQQVVDAKNALLNATTSIANIDEQQRIVSGKERLNKEALKRRLIDEESNEKQQDSGTDLQTSHSERNICKTQFKFNANLPSPSQVFSPKFETIKDGLNIQETNNKLPAKAEPQASNTQKEVLANKQQETSEELVESLVRGDANLAALLNDQQQQNISKEEDMATIASYRPIKRSEIALDEADANFLKAISHSKSAKVEEAPRSPKKLNTEETECTTQNRLSIYENVDNYDKSPELQPNPQLQAKSQANFRSRPKDQEPEQADVKRERKWRKPAPPPPPPPPIVGQKPAHLVFNQKKIQEASVLASSAASTAARGPVSSPPDSPANWSIDDDGLQQMLPLEHSKSESQFIKEKLEKLIKADEENESTGQAPSPQPERKLVSMTSIIQDPNDALMIGALSSKQQQPQQVPATSNEPDQENESAVKNSVARGDIKSLQRRDSTFSYGNVDDASDTDSSFATAAESRKRLLSRFEQTMLSSGKPDGKVDKPKRATATTSTRPKFPAFTEGRLAEGAGPSGSLVKRLAKNFDQTIQEHAAPAPPISSIKPPIGIKPVVNKTITPIRLIPGSARTSFERADDQKSESVWYDANNAAITGLEDVDVDEAELAEFLREFDNDDKNNTQNSSDKITEDEKTNKNSAQQAQRDTSGGRQTLLVTELSFASEEAGSVSTGADPFVTVADSTLEDDARGQAIDDLSEQQVSANDNTLNDDEQLGSEAEDLLTNSEASSSKLKSGGSNKDDNDNSEQYVSLATNASRSPSAERPVAEQPQDDGGNDDDDNYNRQLKQQEKPQLQQQQQQQQQQGKDKTSDYAANSMTTTATKAPQLINISSKKASVGENRESDADVDNNHHDELEVERRTKVPANDNVVLNSQLIDNKFKNSLNNIIAQHQQQNQRSQKNNQQQLPVEPESAESIMTTDEQQQQEQLRAKGKASRSGRSCCLTKNKELKGLSKYYFALLKHGARHKNLKHPNKSPNQEVVNSTKDSTQPGKTATDEYTQSTSDSSITESESDDDDLDEISSMHFSDDENSETGKIDSKKLVRAAKKCCRLYDELERILANRATNELIHKKTNSNKVIDEKNSENQNLNETNIDDRKTKPNTATTTSLTSTTINTTTTTSGEGVDDELGDHYEETLSKMTERYDQVSLSSSSVSSDSIPEIKQRQNMQKLHHIVKEIYSSEAKFVDTLRLLNEDFRQYVTNPQSAVTTTGTTLTTTGSTTSITSSSSSSSSKLYTQALPAECISPILKHLPPLQALSESLLAELKLAKDQWPKTQKIAHVLVKIGPFLKHYSTYIREFESIQQQFTDNMKKYPQFAEKVKEFESSERCQRLTIQHHLLKPIQRIPQYRLLLQKYLHHLKPDNVDYEDTVNALEVVSRVAEHANQAMCEGANFAKLLALQAKIVGKQRDIVQPGRLFVKEGELLKVCRKQIQPRWFILLNDALLYLTQIQSSDILYLNKELPLDDCSVSIPNVDGHQTNNSNSKQIESEFTVTTKTRAFALIAKSRQERDDWVSVFKKTIDDHIARRLSFSNRQQQNANANIT